jgi:hypothetical protein
VADGIAQFPQPGQGGFFDDGFGKMAHGEDDSNSLIKRRISTAETSD